MKRVSRGPSTETEGSEEADCLIGRKQTIVDPSADEAGEGESTVENAVGGIRQSDVLDTASSQIGYGREHPDCGEAKSTEWISGRRHGL